MLEHDRKAHNAGWNDAVHGITTADSSTVAAYVAKLARIVQEAIEKGKATFYHYGIQDALKEHLNGQQLAKVA